MSNYKWYQKSYRRSLMDMHIEDWDSRFLSKYDPAAYVQLLKIAKVQSAMVYANSHVGCCYWPTESGVMHKSLKGKDILGEVVKLCHKDNMDVIVYYSLIFNNRAYEASPAWRTMDINGKASREKNRINILASSRYGVCCPNSMEYRKFVKKQIKELCDGYDFEGMFFDMTFWPDICFCPECEKRFHEETGGEIPRIIDWKDENWLTFQGKREKWLAEFAAFATNTAKQCKPGISVEHNSAPLQLSWKYGASLALVEHNDYIGGDYYGGFLQQSFICKFYYSLTKNQPFEYMTSRCYPDIKDHTTTKSYEMLAVHTYLALAHNGAFLFIDAIDPVGTQDEKVYKVIGGIFGNSCKYEQYLGGVMCQDVGIYFSLASKMNIKMNGAQASLTALDSAEKTPHLDAALGAARTLKENHIPFGIITKINLNQMKHDIVVLPDVLMLDEEEAVAIKKFVADGGSVYASGHSASKRLEDVFGIDCRGETEENVTYIAPLEKGQFLMPDITSNSPVTIFDTQIIAEPADLNDVMGITVLPYTNPSHNGKFASIHSNPPGAATDNPAVIYRTYGKGKVIWVSAPLEKVAHDPHSKVFLNMIKTLAKKPFSFEVDAPSAVEAVMFEQESIKRKVISLINIQEQLPPIPVNNIKIRVWMDKAKPKGVLLLPEEKNIEYKVDNGYLEFSIPQLSIFEMIALDFE